MNEQPEFEVDASKQKLLDWSELWRYKELFYFFTWRDIKIKYKQTVLGFLWAILQPLIMMLIITFFFARALKIPSNNLPYPVFVFSGLLLWTMFSSGLTASANSMVNNASIVKKIYFPRLIIPVSSVLVALFDFFMGLVLFLPLLVYYQQSVSISALWCWPVALIVTVMATLGPGSLLAALNIKYRDFRYVIPFLIQILFFLTPIIYPVNILDHPVLKYIVVSSPMYAAVELFRLPLSNVSPDPLLLAISLTSAFILLIVGLVYFKKTEYFFADLV
jgi:lipopolysaccharide transport system permease protein